MAELLVKLFLKNADTPSERREKTGRLAGLFGIFMNILLCSIKVFAGIITGAVSIVADGVNNLFDALSSVISIICFRLAGKPADKDHPFGHERMEYVITLLLAFLMMFVGYELLKTSVFKILSPSYEAVSILAVVILIVSVLLKLLMFFTLRKFSEMINSTVLRAAAKDSLNDAIATMAVLLAVVLSPVLKFGLDGYAGVLVSVFITWSGISLIRETLDPILGSVPNKELVVRLGEKVLGYEGVIGIHDLIVHSYGPNRIFASVHAEVDASGDILESHDIIDNVEREIFQEMGVELVIHMDPVVTDDENVRKTLDIVSEIIENTGLLLTMHDFRMVTGKTHTNLIFDVVIPFECKKNEKEILKYIQSEVFRIFGRKYYCVINFDRDYNGI